MYYWGLLSFIQSDVPTDLLLYRERSTLLIPDSGEENRFVVQSIHGTIQYLIGSTSEGQYNLMKSFFERVYDCSVNRCEPPDRMAGGRVLLNSWRNRRRRDFYYPSFIRNMINLPDMASGLEFQYQVVIRSSEGVFRKRKFSFAILFGYSGSSESIKAAEVSMADEIRRLRKRFRWKLVRKRNNGRLSAFSMTDPFSLSTFVRVPAAEDRG